LGKMYETQSGVYRIILPVLKLIDKVIRLVRRADGADD
jgi:hypothetical protein